jgi:hypothetical protein
VECEVVAHELGHAFGLEHEYLCKDPMTYLEGCGHKTFQDVAAPCGEDEPRACSGGGKQNSVQHLTQVLGLASDQPNIDDPPSPPTPKPKQDDDDDDSGKNGDEGEVAAPVIGLVSPQDGATFEEQSTVSVTANVESKGTLEHVALLWEKDGTTSRFDCEVPAAGVTCKQSGSKYTWTLKVGAGERAWAVAASDAQGHETISKPRTLSFSSADGDEAKPEPPEPPVTSGGAEVSIVYPQDNATIHAGQRLGVKVEVPSDRTWKSVVLVWKSKKGEQLYPLKDYGEGTWVAKIPIDEEAAEGDRTILVRAIDEDGEITEGAPRRVHLEAAND